MIILIITIYSLKLEENKKRPTEVLLEFCHSLETVQGTVDIRTVIQSIKEKLQLGKCSYICDFVFKNNRSVSYIYALFIV